MVIGQSSERREIEPARRRGGLIGCAFLAVVALCLLLAIRQGTALPAVIGAVVFGPLAAWPLRNAVRPGPAIVLDEMGFWERRSDRTVPWTEVSAVVPREQRGTFGVSHELVIKLKSAGSAPQAFFTSNRTNHDEMTINLDWLAPKWTETARIFREMRDTEAAEP